MEKPVTFIDEMLREAEEKERQERIEFDLLKADSALGAISKIESAMASVNALADEEVKLIEHYRKTELERLDKKRNWLVINLDGFLRKHNEETGEKSLRLPHGSIGLRKSRDRVEISNPELFAKVADRLGLWRVSPEKKEVDLQAVSAAIKIQKSIPGVVVIPGSINFHYNIHTNGSNNNGQIEPSET